MPGPTNDIHESKGSTRGDALATTKRQVVEATNNTANEAPPLSFEKIADCVAPQRRLEARKDRRELGPLRMQALQEPQPHLPPTSLNAVLVADTTLTMSFPSTPTTPAESVSRPNTRIMSGRAWPPILSPPAHSTSPARCQTPKPSTSPPLSASINSLPYDPCTATTHLPRLIYGAYDMYCVADVGGLEATAKLPRISWRYVSRETATTITTMTTTTSEVTIVVVCDRCGEKLGMVALGTIATGRGKGFGTGEGKRYVGQRQVIPYVPWTARERGSRIGLAEMR